MDQLHAYLNLITLLDETSQFVAAAEACEQALKRHPDNPTLHSKLARLLANPTIPELLDLPRALNLARKAVDLERDFAANWNTLGIVHYRMGNWDECLAALEVADQTDKGSEALMWFVRAMAKWKLNRQDDAIDEFRRAVDWMERKKPTIPELDRFRTEAGKVLGQ